MAGKVIMIVCCWACACIFFGIGVYASHRKDPMWFWSGSQVPPESVSDIPAYNRAQSVMWKIYSLPYWAAGAVSWFSPAGAGVLLVAACILGIPPLLFVHNRIEKRYRK